MKQRTVYTDKVRLIYLQLPYFTKEADDCENDFERIIYVLKHMDVLKRMPWILQDSVFKKLSEIAEVASLNNDERKQYDESLRHYRDTLIVMEGQYLEGEKKGHAEGRAEEKIDNARSLKKNGVPIDIISKSLGLTPEEIEAL
jgi:predicted transposase/invertase (TIGR01784 family)